jgi:16S rRNA (cytidine1402-2'-O)-methyltransferase
VTIPALTLLQAAEDAAGGQQYPAAALYVVATPIGNLADITLRALHVLARVDSVACEDTRHSAALLRHIGLHKPLMAVHAHNEHQAAEGVCARLAQGQRVAYVSDAGTPAVSDPGAALVAAVREAGYRVIPIPGPSSALAALSVAGDVQGEGFRLRGFAPAKGAAREQALRACLDDAGTQILFEAPHRIQALARELQAAAQALGAEALARRITVCRELTKQFEQVDTLALEGLPGWFDADPQRQRGEFVLVLHARARPAAASASAADASAPGSEAEAPLAPDVQRLLSALLEELPLKQAVGLAVKVSGLGRNQLYQAALRLKG